MNYFLFKLRFETAVHFGPSDAALSLAASEEHVRADTLFSALCQTALCLYGPEGVEELCGQVQEGYFAYKMVDLLLQLLLCRFSIAQFLPKRKAAGLGKKAKACRLRDAILCDL